MSDKPAAKVIKPSQVGSAVSPDNYDALRDAQETQSRRAELESRDAAKANKVAQAIGANYYIQEKTWDFLTHQGRQMSVTEFYPELNIAIDKFYDLDDWELSMVKSKQTALKQHGIKYAFLTPEKSISDLAVDLGL